MFDSIIVEYLLCKFEVGFHVYNELLVRLAFRISREMVLQSKSYLVYAPCSYQSF
jgi:hypothetical protein